MSYKPEVRSLRMGLAQHVYRVAICREDVIAAYQSLEIYSVWVVQLWYPVHGLWQVFAVPVALRQLHCASCTAPVNLLERVMHQVLVIATVLQKRHPI